MTRKHYKLIASAMLQTMPERHNVVLFGLWENTVVNLSYALVQTNDAFDRQRFIRACQGKER